MHAKQTWFTVQYIGPSGVNDGKFVGKKTRGRPTEHWENVKLNVAKFLHCKSQN